MVAHPPCAQWGMLSHMAIKNPKEKRLALLAVDWVRRDGGVLEHPRLSKLWTTAELPAPGEPADAWGGWTLMVSQKWWGHMAEKLTLLYIVGVQPSQIPPMPLTLGHAEFTCCQSGRRRNRARSMDRKEMPKSLRDHTPPSFAAWLVLLARLSKVPA